MKNWNCKNLKPEHWYWTIAAGVTLVFLTLFCFPTERGQPPALRAVNHTPQEAWEAAQKHLKAADNETDQAIKARLQQVSAYFNRLETDGRLEQFAGEVLSLSAKWQWITTDGGQFDDYIASQFAS